MFYPTEAKSQDWRAVAVFDDRPEALIYVGSSAEQVGANFPAALFEVLDDEEREAVRSIRLERWKGAPDAGQWSHQSMLSVPTGNKIAQNA